MFCNRIACCYSFAKNPKPTNFEVRTCCIFSYGLLLTQEGSSWKFELIVWVGKGRNRQHGEGEHVPFHAVKD